MWMRVGRRAAGSLLEQLFVTLAGAVWLGLVNLRQKPLFGLTLCRSRADPACGSLPQPALYELVGLHWGHICPGRL